MAEVEKRTAAWTATSNARIPRHRTAKTRLPEGISLERSLDIADANQAYFVRIGSGPSQTSEDRYAAGILASILGDEGGSRLFWDLIDTGRAEVATVWSHEFIDTGILVHLSRLRPRGHRRRIAS